MIAARGLAVLYLVSSWFAILFERQHCLPRYTTPRDEKPFLLSFLWTSLSIIRPAEP